MALTVEVSPALASKQPVDYIGGSASGSLGGEFQGTPPGVAVNDSGAGGVPAGTVYVTDGGSLDRPEERGNRVQRFQRDDNGTPGTTTDDTYKFVSAWGAGVEKGGTNYEICTVAASCRDAEGVGGNGTLAGDGALSNPSAIAVDQDTGEVYVADSSARRTHDDNFRVNVYAANGEFLRSFGWDVVEAGPDDNGTGYEICKAGIDVCKAGTTGSGIGQIGSEPSGEGAAEGIAVSQPDGNPAMGTVFLADQHNNRVNTYALDGSSPSSFGSSAIFGFRQPGSVAVDSRGIVYLSNQKNGEEIERYDSENADGGGIGFLSPITTPALLYAYTTALAVEPDPDGAGPKTDVLYANRVQPEVIQQFGPVNPPGLSVPPSTADEVHGNNGIISAPTAIAAEPSTGRLYAAAYKGEGGNVSGGGPGVYVLDNVGPTPTASLDSITGVTAHAAEVHGTIDPNGPPTTNYYLEYSTDGIHWESTPEVVLGTQETPQAVAVMLEPPVGGLQANTLYHVRLVAARNFAEPVVTSEQTFTTLGAAPLVETTGSPVRTATGVRLDSRVDPQSTTTTYYFEYGSEGSCASAPCAATAPQSAGSGGVYELVSQQVEGLSPDTTYHYRVVADNGVTGSPTYGEDMTVTTRSSDEPLTHGHFPGPTGSDRAWEQVNTPNMGGNPVNEALAISDDGERVVYRTHGGNPISNTGNAFNQLFAQRTASGWQTKDIYPARDELVASAWRGLYADGSLSSLASLNNDNGVGRAAVFRFSPEMPAKQGFQLNATGYPTMGASDDTSRILMTVDRNGSEKGGFFDVTSGAAQTIAFLPGGAPACMPPENSPFAYPTTVVPRAPRWISPDGKLAFFPSLTTDCRGSSQLYVRDIEAAETKLISGTALSGRNCGAVFIRSTPGAVFFWTQSRLDPQDVAVKECGSAEHTGSEAGADVYRYDLDSGGLECVTCTASGIQPDIPLETSVFRADTSIAVSEDGSRVYFHSSKALLPGAAAGIYRVKVADGDLAYVGAGGRVGDAGTYGEAISPDGSTLVFTSRNPGLNAIGGQQNGGEQQYYLYDDIDRSLACVSCPQDGSVPRAGVAERLTADHFETGPNTGPLSSDGKTFAFVTPTPLVSADQNTASSSGRPGAGSDVYEWRDGRLLLVTDGLTNWPVNGNEESQAPEVDGIDPSGRDIFFTAAAQYTPDALDGYARMYDARIGGGFEYPVAPKPCPLEVCQGTPKGAPEERAPGTSSFAGAGNPKSPARHKKAHKKKVHRKKAHKKSPHHRADNKRRAVR